ncbi:MAG TPA: hypothetical protein VGP70_17440 [Actinomadura sp.]|jgi:hypothetical protein|nr:hypothetical protein [Actinomadura sp.]
MISGEGASILGFDVVLDPVAGDDGHRSLRTLRDGGTLVSILPLADGVAAEAAEHGIRAGFRGREEHGPDLPPAGVVSGGAPRHSPPEAVTGSRSPAIGECPAPREGSW